MWKPVIVGAAALTIVGSSLALAQQGRNEGPRRMPSAEDLQAFGDARLAALKAGLALKPDQEKNWPAFEQAARDVQKLRLDRIAARQQQGERRRDPVERLQQRADAMTQTGQALKKLADAAGPLYSSLDENQKRRFVVLSRLGGGERGRMMNRRREGGLHGFNRSEYRGERRGASQGGERL